MDPEKITYFGETDSRSKRVRFGIKAKDRTKHVYIIGKTGMGKSTLLENMAIQDIKNGEGMAIIDPHGKTADLLLDHVPPERIKDIIYFAPFDIENPISFNVMEDVGPDKRHLVVSGLMSAFKKLFGEESFSDRMQYILQNAILALLEYPGATMLGINRMLTDKAYRNKVVTNVTDTAVKAYWTQEFASYTERFAAEATPAILNKIGQFTSNPLIRNIIGQAKSSFDFRKVMDEKKIMVINLSKGRVGEANANLLGSMLITKMYLAAMSRADINEKQLKNLPNFYLYVDEFQSFANESFADILSEARKYKLNLTIAHQYIEQMSEEVRAAVFGNVGTMIAFRVGAFDAEVLEKEFAPQFTIEDLVNLGLYQMYLKLMIDGVSSVPFSASSILLFPEPVISYKSEIIESSRRQFAEKKGKVEETINIWYQEGKTVPQSIKPKMPSAPFTPIVTQQQKEFPRAFQDTKGPSMPIQAKEQPKTFEQRPAQNFAPRPVNISQNNQQATLPSRNARTPEIFNKAPDPTGDDFLPLKDFVKNVSKESQGVEKKQNIPVQPLNNNSSNKNSSDLKSALEAVLKSKNIPKAEEKAEPKPVEKNVEKTISDNPKEIPEKDLKKVLGIEE